MASTLDHPADAQSFREKAARLRAAYVRTFLNPRTGVLAGWKSADGQLHDYWFTFVQGVAISYGLVDDEVANAIMDRLLGKMREVGYTNFALGLPGNLVPVRKGDYLITDVAPEQCGAPRREDGSDGFQFYENGGATGCFAYFTIKALYRLGRREDTRRILLSDARRLCGRRFPRIRAQWDVPGLARLAGRLPRLRRSAGGQLPDLAGLSRRPRSGEVVLALRRSFDTSILLLLHLGTIILHDRLTMLQARWGYVRPLDLWRPEDPQSDRASSAAPSSDGCCQMLDLFLGLGQAVEVVSAPKGPFAGRRRGFGPAPRE